MSTDSGRYKADSTAVTIGAESSAPGRVGAERLPPPGIVVVKPLLAHQPAVAHRPVPEEGRGAQQAWFAVPPAWMVKASVDP